jgi:AGCS family alanine or glycine:cation symporter
LTQANEAGLGTAVIINCMSSETSASKQGMWASLAVFIDTVVICLLTALAILVTGADKMGGEALAGDGTTFTLAAFESVFGSHANMFLSACIALFAVATASGWSLFGAVCVEYLLGKRYIKYFLIIFTLCCFVGATARLEIIWGLSDIFNGLMAAPNLLALLLFGLSKGFLKIKD